MSTHRLWKKWFWKNKRNKVTSLKLGKRFPRIPRTDERESQTTGIPSATAAVCSPLVDTCFLSIDRLHGPYTKVHDVGPRVSASWPIEQR